MAPIPYLIQDRPRRLDAARELRHRFRGEAGVHGALFQPLLPFPMAAVCRCGDGLMLFGHFGMASLLPAPGIADLVQLCLVPAPCGKGLGRRIQTGFGFVQCIGRGSCIQIQQLGFRHQS